jgi:hypothetical protein
MSFIDAFSARIMRKDTLIDLITAGLLVAVGAIYLISAYEEPIQAAEEETAAPEGGVSTNTGMDMGTLVQTTFFAIAGLVNIGVAAWIIVSRRRMAKTSYMIAAVGSTFLIVLYIASRTINLPIVGIQDDIGMVDIVSKVMQGIIVGLSAYAVSISRKLNEEIKNRMR